ncbi:hypothetical protein AAZX31_06G189600 [Glycine max]
MCSGGILFCSSLTPTTHSPWFSAQEDEDEPHPNLLRTTVGNGPPESVFDWTREIDSDLSNQNINNQAFSRKHWRLLQCQDGLRTFEELGEVVKLITLCVISCLSLFSW